ncbi:MAG: patatin family protein [Lachnospiraceae bacterium]|nr:patatin family protein [Lachnospiraceae bacterium]
MGTGIVLEGGAMRGMFTAGVIDVMLENNIEFAGAVGVSAGAVFGCNLKSKQIGRAIRYNKRFAKDWRYCSVRSLLLTGDMFGAEFCYEKVPFHYDPFDLKTYRSNPMPLYAVMTDVDTGKAVYKRLDEGSGLDMLYFRASASMPLASRPVEILGRSYLDGGMTDSIPLRFMQKKGYEKNVVVLTQPQDYVKEPMRDMRVIGALLKKYPRMVRALGRRHIMYNKETAYVYKCRDEGSVFVIQPPEPLHINHTEHDPEELQRVYDIGRRTMEANLEDLKAFMNRGDGVKGPF